MFFIPVIQINDIKNVEANKNTSFFSHVISSFVVGSRNFSVWVAGSLESFVYMILYAIKAFLPIYASSIGFNIALIGGFFSIQEAVRLIFNPVGGKIADKLDSSIVTQFVSIVMVLSAENVGYYA